MFGDGGITAIAANCFNMAVVMPFVAYYGYKLISGNTEITSSRRVIAAAIAGYISLARSSVLRASNSVFSHCHQTAEGVPLYMPYPLSVTVPAMVIEHVFGFSILEALITALIFAYIQRTDTTIFMEKNLSAEEKNEMQATA